MTKTLSVGDLLYHSVHGLCCIKEIIKEKEAGKEKLRYALVPKLFSQMKLRFVIGADDVYASGFHTPVSLKEANAILEYLTRSQVTATPLKAEPTTLNVFAEKNQTWALAQSLLSCSRDEMQAKEQKKRQTLHRSAKGLVRELAFVFEITAQEAAEKIRKSLERTLKVNSLVLSALESAHES
ncbi:MAG: hypothetical protein EXS63_02590 [Candidatus Omnitrophica bacterium]|nr:hypothetical protein [Candidatus Omnitrophota bacterium]